jgi:phosphate transport system protein
MVQELLLCFLTDSTSKAQEIIDSDTNVDYLHDVLSKRLLQDLGQQESAKAQMRAQFLFCGRFLERMGDACTSIAKRVYFLSTGERISKGA